MLAQQARAALNLPHDPFNQKKLRLLKASFRLLSEVFDIFFVPPVLTRELNETLGN